MYVWAKESICMFMHMCMCVQVYVCVHTVRAWPSANICLYKGVCISACTCACVYACVYVCVCLNILECVCAYLCVSKLGFVCLYVWWYSYNHTNAWQLWSHSFLDMKSLSNILNKIVIRFITNDTHWRMLRVDMLDSASPSHSASHCSTHPVSGNSH